MKFVLILACLLAVAYANDAAPVEDQSNKVSVEKELEKALVEAGVDPEVAHGWLKKIARKVGGFVQKAVPYVQKGLEIYETVVD
ncbi:hypothetical protein pipiens_012095 [Culex pipiens pipiens]|uniref:Uncharacterized protein n=1 Tax=Culex pipiens pipiens TaxID=38569 RepID=A0ABD1D6P1_CULPP